MFERKTPVYVGIYCLRYATGILNRDESQSPKSLNVNGYQRAMVSSQCTKYNLLHDLGVRTEFESDEDIKKIALDSDDDDPSMIMMSETDLFRITGVDKNGKEGKKKKDTEESENDKDSNKGGVSVKVSLKAIKDFLNSKDKSKTALENTVRENPSLGIALTGSMWASAGIKVESKTQFFMGLDISETEFTDDTFIASSDLNRKGAITMGSRSPSAYILYNGCTIDVSGIVDFLMDTHKYTRDKAIETASLWVKKIYLAMVQLHYRSMSTQFGEGGDAIGHMVISKNALPPNIFQHAFHNPYPKGGTLEKASEFMGDKLKEYCDKNWNDNWKNANRGNVSYSILLNDSDSIRDMESTIKEYLK